jgi:hypothetical protein
MIMGFPNSRSKPNSVSEAIRDSTWRQNFTPENSRRFRNFDVLPDDGIGVSAGKVVFRQPVKAMDWWDQLDFGDYGKSSKKRMDDARRKSGKAPNPKR